MDVTKQTNMKYPQYTNSAGIHFAETWRQKNFKGLESSPTWTNQKISVYYKGFNFNQNLPDEVDGVVVIELVVVVDVEAVVDEEDKVDDGVVVVEVPGCLVPLAVVVAVTVVVGDVVVVESGMQK